MYLCGTDPGHLELGVYAASMCMARDQWDEIWGWLVGIAIGDRLHPHGESGNEFGLRLSFFFSSRNALSF